MRLLTILFAVALLGVGCFSSPTPTPAPTPASGGAAGTVPAAPGAHPPEVVMTVGSETYPGIEGSYCYAGTCVDKIGPVGLVAEAVLPYKDVAIGSQLDFTVGGQVFEFAGGIMDASGTDLGLRPVSFKNGKYNFKLPSNIRGKILVNAMVRFGASGGEDVQYIFPVNVR